MTMNYEQRFRLFLWGIRLLGASRVSFLAYRLAALWGRWFSPRKDELELVRQRLMLCFPDNPTMQETACRSYLENSAINSLNAYFYNQMSPRWLGRQIRIVDEGPLQTALQAGKGVLVLTAHYHHLVMLAVTLGLMGLRMNPILLDPKLTVPAYMKDYMDRLINDSECQFNGGRYVMVDLASGYVRKVYRLFEANEIVLSANDFPPDLAPKRRLSFPFLGQQLSCPLGSVEIALSRKASIVGAVISWRGGDCFEVGFSTINTDSDVAGVMAQYARELEAAVVRDPGGWEAWKWGQLFSELDPALPE